MEMKRRKERKNDLIWLDDANVLKIEFFC
jgi:hypothetical protein